MLTKGCQPHRVEKQRFSLHDPFQTYLDERTDRHCEDGQREGNFTIEDRTDKIIDAKGSYLIPAIVDLNIRLLDGVLNSKNIKTIADEAKKGGVGHLVLNADSTPSIDSESILEFAQNIE